MIGCASAAEGRKVPLWITLAISLGMALVSSTQPRPSGPSASAGVSGTSPHSGPPAAAAVGAPGTVAVAVVDARSGTAGVGRSGSGCWLTIVCECKAVATTSHSAEKAGRRGGFDEWRGWPRSLGPSGGNGVFCGLGASAADRETGGVDVGREVAWGSGKVGTCATIAEGVDCVMGAPAADGGAGGVVVGREVAWGSGKVGTCATIAAGVDCVMGAPAADGGADGVEVGRDVAWGRG